MFVIAHPTKLKKENKRVEPPTMYDISGSAHFFNLTHNGISVYRDFNENTTIVSVQKVKHEWLGSKGDVKYMYDGETRQYIYISHEALDGNWRKKETSLPEGNWKQIDLTES